MNISIFLFLYGLAKNNVIINLLAVFLAQYLILILIVAAAAMIFLDKDSKERYYFSALAVLSVILSNGIVVPIINYFYYSPRPFALLPNVTALISHASNSSMPSGHMMFVVPLALTMFYWDKRTGWWFLGSAFLIGLGRAMTGVHWPLDIAVGALLGALCFYAVKWALYLAGLKAK